MEPLAEAMEMNVARDRVAPTAVSLLVGLFDLEPEQRATAEAVASDAWLKAVA